MTSTRSIWRTSKDEAVAPNAMVTANHPRAADIGLEVLRSGGNAVDAAVAVGFAKGVLEPGGSGLGGGGLMIVNRSQEADVHTIDFNARSPAAALPGVYPLEASRETPRGRLGWRNVTGDQNLYGYRAVAVPGQVAGLAAAHQRFGRASWASLLAPAVHLAERGFTIDAGLALSVVKAFRKLVQRPASAQVFLPDGAPPHPAVGADPYAPFAADPTKPNLFTQPDLAKALSAIATDGPAVFYQGWIGDAITTAMAEHAGGWIQPADLACFQPVIHHGGQVTSYRNHPIVGVPGPHGCFTVQQALLLLEHLTDAPDQLDHVDYLHLQAEAYRMAFADRRAYGGDEETIPVPYAGLLSPGYAAARTGEVTDVASTKVTAGSPWEFDPSPRPHGAPLTPGRAVPEQPSTTHICVADHEGNVVALTQTLADTFGSAVVIGGTGIVMNNSMQNFDPEPGRPNSIGPNRRGLNSKAPLLVMTKQGGPLLAVGASGGQRIINAVTQIISHVLDRGMGIQDAVRAPRIDVSGPPLLADHRLGDDVVDGLRRKGHDIHAVAETSFATPLAILIDPHQGTLHGGVDPTPHAVAAGY